MPKYPDIEVELLGENGNAMVMVSKTRRALMRGEVPPEEVKEFFEEALSGDYDKVVRTILNWVTVK